MYENKFIEKILDYMEEKDLDKFLKGKKAKSKNGDKVFEIDLNRNKIIIFKINKMLFKGFLILFGNLDNLKIKSYLKNENFKTLTEGTLELDSVLSINGGGFSRKDGVPQARGAVISDGIVCNEKIHTIAGFDYNNEFKINSKKPYRIALEFGPTLIENGKPKKQKKTKFACSRHPRTLWGQTKNGLGVIMCIQGRSLNSLGATLDDCIKILQKYDVINAYNLDGGGSTELIYKGQKLITTCDLKHKEGRLLPNIIYIEKNKSI